MSTPAAARTIKIAAIPADGVGAEVVAAGRTVLDALAARSDGDVAWQWTEFDWGSEYYAREGRMMAADGLDQLRDFDAIYFGAVGWPSVPDHVSLWGLRLAICQGFDQWANVRPVHFHPGITSPLRQADDTELDWVVVRENSEGEYAGLGGRNLSGRGPGNEVAVQPAQSGLTTGAALSAGSGVRMATRGAKRARFGPYTVHVVTRAAKCPARGSNRRHADRANGSVARRPRL